MVVYVVDTSVCVAEPGRQVQLADRASVEECAALTSGRRFRVYIDNCVAWVIAYEANNRVVVAAPPAILSRAVQRVSEALRYTPLRRLGVRVIDQKTVFTHILRKFVNQNTLAY